MLMQIFKRSFCCDATRTLKGKVALVTGANIGIGYATTYEFLKNGVKHVCMANRDEKTGKQALEKIRKKFGEDSAFWTKLDVSDHNNIEKVFIKLCEKWGQLDIVVNNAGILNDKEWKKTIDTNITAVVKGSQLAFKYMSKENGGNGGVIINLSSILGTQLWGSVPVYTASKHFVRAYSQCIGMPYHYCKSGIRVLIMCPGVTITSMITEAGNRTKSEADKQELIREVKSVPEQPVECVAKGMIHMIKHGDSGSCWVSEGKEFYEIIIPKRQSLKKKGLIKLKCGESKSKCKKC